MSPELRFVAACGRWPADDHQRAKLGALQPLVNDWVMVAALAEAHRVEGLVWRAVDAAEIALPEPVAAKLKAASEQVRMASLQAIAETLRICGRLDAGGIEHRVIKGLPVAAIAFGTPVIKNSIDIDILVRPSDAVRTAVLLSELGYGCAYPPQPLDAGMFDRLSPVAKEACFVSPRGQVDLHWRLIDQPALLKGLDPWADPRLIELLPGHPVATLPDAGNLAYLAAHGALSGWSRLKWLADFSAFLAGRPEPERERLCGAARAFTGGRIVDQALILVERLFGPGLVPSPAGNGQPAKRLAALALLLIESRHPDRVLENGWRSRLAISRLRMSLRGGLGYRLREAGRGLRRQEVHVRLRWPLPRPLHAVYLIAAPMGLVVGLGSFARRQR